MGQSWSIIVFSYNEAGNIEQVLNNVSLFCSSILYNRLYEVIVVDDGSNDESEQLIKEFVNQNNHFLLIRKATNQGIGNALKSGYSKAKYMNICAIPADGQFNIKELEKYLDFEESIYISFYRPIKTGYNWYRNLLSDLNKFLNKTLLNLDLKDVNWIKIYKKSQLDAIQLKLDSSLIESEICAKLNFLQYKAKEVPSSYDQRKFGKSKGGSFKTLTKAFWELFIFMKEYYRFKKQTNLKRKYENKNDT